MQRCATQAMPTKLNNSLDSLLMLTVAMMHCSVPQKPQGCEPGLDLQGRFLSPALPLAPGEHTEVERRDTQFAPHCQKTTRVHIRASPSPRLQKT